MTIYIDVFNTKWININNSLMVWIGILPVYIFYVFDLNFIGIHILCFQLDLYLHTPDLHLYRSESTLRQTQNNWHTTDGNHSKSKHFWIKESAKSILENMYFRIFIFCSSIGSLATICLSVEYLNNQDAMLGICRFSRATSNYHNLRDYGYLAYDSIFL
jgi:hypothetical protein